MNIGRLSELLNELPGVGRRQAERLALYLARRGPSYSSELLRELDAIHRTFKICNESYQIFFSEDPTVTTSPYIRDTTRSWSELLVVEKDSDIEPLEKAGYRGQYFVLGALIPIIPKKAVRPRSDELLTIISNRLEEGKLREVIFGLSWTPEAEYTRETLIEQLSPLIEKYGVSVSNLGRGLSTGSELEYADRATLEYALNSRTKALD